MSFLIVRVERGAKFKEAHRDKASIRSFLAVCEDPGLGYFDALEDEVLDPTSPHAQPFVNWFKRLYFPEGSA